ncbi:MgtC/SapB family protein [Kordiimonas aestuarii]|uniref:MgtC/SapB family protein n=1 Tax=Kordiimonas aestuarii TaxID=1005925 RepID=UPI0021D353B8|nr:MgtC/SapB family protein [Kordiimonas aestuarii]
METLLSTLNISVVSLPELVLRVALALILGMIIGLDRDNKNKPIDFRAYMIIAVSSCGIAILGQEIQHVYLTTEGTPHIDMSKLMEGVLTGIGFLGAGAIVKQGNIVVGTATGASIWASGTIGLTVGFGFYGVAILIFLAIVLTLTLGGIYREKVQGIADSGPNKKEEMNGKD